MNTKILTYSKAKESFFLAAEVEGRSKRTLELYEETLRAFESFLNSEDPIEVEPNDIRRFLFHLKDKGYAKATIFTHIKELKVFYSFLVSEEIIEKSPMQSIKQIRMPKLFPYCPSEEDIHLLFSVTKGKTFEAKRNYCLLTLFISTGIRVSEACNLTLDDINLAAFTLIVRGKGEKERTVLFDKHSAKALNAYLKVRLNVPFENALFISAKRDEPLTRNGILQIIRRLAKKAGIMRRIFPHSLRHFFATEYLRRGGSIVVLQHLLGHSDLKTVLIYVNMTQRDLREDYFKTVQSRGR